MSIKVKAACLLTLCLLAFQALPAIAKDSTKETSNDATMYQQLLTEKATTNQALNSQIQKVDKEKATALFESMKAKNNSSSTNIYEVEPNDSISTADTIGLDQIVNGTITDVYYDLDYYKLPITKTGSLTLAGIMGAYNTSTENSYFGLCLVDSNGNILGHTSLQYAAGLYGQAMQISVQPGTYYIVALQTYKSSYYVGEPYQFMASLSTSSTDIQPTSVSLNKSALTLAQGATQTLVATVSPSNATNQDVTWVSGDPSVATVDASGLVTAVSPGKTTITVTTTDGAKTDSCDVTVTGQTKTVKTLSANPSTLNLAVDETSNPITLTATYTDGSTEDVTDSATWTSKNPSVATVDEYGAVTGVANGSTTITGTYGGEIATITITITDNTTPQLNSISVQPESVSVAYGKTQAVKIYAVDANNSQVDVTKLAKLVSADTTIATVTGATIKGICVGTTSVTVTYLDQTADIPVTVTAPVTALTADPSGLNLLVDGTEMITLTATYKDGSEGDVTESAAWKSSKPSVATVDEYGTVTGVAIGSTTITATYGGKTATIAVTVVPELDHILVQPGSVGVAKGKTQVVTIYAVYADGSTADITKSIRLTSDDTTVATVTGATIKGITADCETTITGTYLDQDIEIPVTVTQPLKTLISDAGTSGLNLSIDDTETINLTATYADASSEDVNDRVTAVSSKPSVATVDVADGSITVTAIAKGSATITLSYEGKKVTVKVKVTE